MCSTQRRSARCSKIRHNTSYEINLVKTDELRAVIELWWQDGSDGADEMLRMIFPDCRERKVIKWLYEDALNYLGHDKNPSNEYFCARRQGSEQIEAVAYWTWKGLTPPADQPGRDRQWATWFRRGPPAIPGMNEYLSTRYSRATYMAHADAVGDQPYAMLNMLVAERSPVIRDAENALLAAGLAKVDQAGVSCFVCAGRRMKYLYETHGFVVKEKIDFNAKEYGGIHDGETWTMMQPAKSGSLGKEKE